MSKERLSRATCRIYVDGGQLPVGTGTLVTTRHILTAAHLVRGAVKVAIRFREGLDGEALRVSLLDLPAAENLDIAVLALPDEGSECSGPGTSRPSPAEMWPARRWPTNVTIYGYPPKDPFLEGQWCEAMLGNAVQGGRVQLDWHDRVLVGHHGAPVGSPDGRMVGLLVEGSESGNYDRMIPVAEIRRVWPELPRPWHYAGSRGSNGRGHFSQRANGQSGAAQEGDLFRGREEALRAVRDWFVDSSRHEERLLVLTAQPGAGKSAVLARAVMKFEEEQQADGLAFHARNATISEFVDALAAALGLETPQSWDDLISELADRESTAPVVIAVDALDEAAVDGDLGEWRNALQGLASLDSFRVAVATRPLTTDGDAFRQGGHLYRLGVKRREGSPNLVDLDLAPYFAASDLAAYADVLLAQTGVPKPRPPGAAWERYRVQDDVRARLADVVAARADRNFLVAGMSAIQLARKEAVVDPRSDHFAESLVPSGVGEALDKYLDPLPKAERRRVTAQLSALAYGRGAGLDDQQWLAFAKVLGGDDIVASDLDNLRDSPAADYLLQSSSGAEGTLTQLFHQALADQFVAGRRSPHDDERRLVALLKDECGKDERGQSGWVRASPYGRRHAPSHAAAAGQLEELMNDPEFLVAMAPDALGSALTTLTITGIHTPSAIYHTALPFLGNDPGANAAVLEVVSRVQGNDALANRLGSLGVGRPYRAVPKLRPMDRPLARLDGHTDRVRSVASLAWPALDHPAVVTGSDDGTTRVWDPRRPDGELARLGGRTASATRSAAVHGIASLKWPGREFPVVVTACGDGTARILDPQPPEGELGRFDGHGKALWGVATLSWPGRDLPVVVTTSEDGTARVWDPQHPETELARFDGHARDKPVWAIAVLPWPDWDHPALVTGSGDGTARVWDPQHPDTELARFDGHGKNKPVWAIAVLPWPDLDHPVVVTAGEDYTALVWDPRDDSRELARFDRHAAGVWGVAPLPWPGRGDPVLVTVSDDNTARVWDPHNPEVELARFDGHTGGIRSVTTIGWPGVDHPVVVTASDDWTAQVWDHQHPAGELARFGGHTDGVWYAARLEWPGRQDPLVVTVSADHTARVWDPKHPEREMARFEGHDQAVWGVATLNWPHVDHKVVVTTSDDCTARVWDPQPPVRELACFDGHDQAVWGIATLAWPGSTDRLVSVSADATARVWDPLPPVRELARFDGHTGPLTGVATIHWPNLGHNAVVTISEDCTARIWDPQPPVRELARFDRHTNVLWGVAILPDWRGLGHAVVVTASLDGTARVWDPLDADRELACFDRHTAAVYDVATIECPSLGHLAVVSASDDGYARIWDPENTDDEIARLPLLSQGMGITSIGAQRPVITTTRGFLSFDLTSDAQSDRPRRTLDGSGVSTFHEEDRRSPGKTGT